MPFTPAHSAIVLPFLRSRYFSATALITGSVAPDFEYFLKLSVDGIHGHTWPGLFYFDLPVAIVLSVVFHRHVKRNLICNLPPFFQRRFTSILDIDYFKVIKTSPFIVIFSALIGSATHILWDGFTHGGGMFVQYFDFYDGAYIRFQGVNYPLWYGLQHISTLVGMIAVTIYIALLAPQALRSQPRFSYWLLLTGITIVVVIIRFTIYSHDYNIGNLVVSAISGMCAGLIICGMVRFSTTSARE